MIPPNEKPSERSDQDVEDLRPTRSELTRAATETNRLGIQLTKLSPGDLDRLELPERLREEIDVCQKLKPRSRGRQNRLIGQLLRAEGADEIKRRLESLSAVRRRDIQQEKMSER